MAIVKLKVNSILVMEKGKPQTENNNLKWKKKETHETDIYIKTKS